MPVEENFYGCELDIKSHKVACYLYPTANLEHKDIRFYKPDMRFDYVVGNPPFNLKWETESGTVISQMYYCLKAAQLMKPLGLMAIVVPASFLNDSYLDSAKISELSAPFGRLRKRKALSSDHGQLFYPDRYERRCFHFGGRAKRDRPSCQRDAAGQPRPRHPRSVRRK